MLHGMFALSSWHFLVRSFWLRKTFLFSETSTISRHATIKYITSAHSKSLNLLNLFLCHRVCPSSSVMSVRSVRLRQLAQWSRGSSMRSCPLQRSAATAADLEDTSLKKLRSMLRPGDMGRVGGAGPLWRAKATRPETTKWTSRTKDPCFPLPSPAPGQQTYKWGSAVWTSPWAPGPTAFANLQGFKSVQRTNVLWQMPLPPHLNQSYLWVLSIW